MVGSNGVVQVFSCQGGKVSIAMSDEGDRSLQALMDVSTARDLIEAIEQAIMDAENAPGSPPVVLGPARPLRQS